MTATLLRSDRPTESVPVNAGPAGRALTGPVLVAAGDGSPIEGALRVAQLLARRDVINAHVLTPVEPLPFTVSLLTGLDAAPLDEGRRLEQLARTRQRVQQTVGISAHFSMAAELGNPSHTVTRAARERSAEMILVGLACRGSNERATTEDAALQVIRTARLPTLAVPSQLALLPRNALVAMDFGDASTRAARMALMTLAAGGRLTLVHVVPDLDLRHHGRDGLAEIHAEGVAGLFRRLIPELRAPGDIDVGTVILRGEPSREILSLATRGRFDLIAAGSRNVAWPDADLTGSVSTALLRGAAGAVLITPPTEERA